MISAISKHFGKLNRILNHVFNFVNEPTSMNLAKAVLQCYRFRCCYHTVLLFEQLEIRYMVRYDVLFVHIELNVLWVLGKEESLVLSSQHLCFSFIRSFGGMDIWSKWSKYFLCMGLFVGGEGNNCPFHQKCEHVKLYTRRKPKRFVCMWRNYRTGPTVPNVQI